MKKLLTFLSACLLCVSFAATGLAVPLTLDEPEGFSIKVRQQGGDRTSYAGPWVLRNDSDPSVPSILYAFSYYGAVHPGGGYFGEVTPLPFDKQNSQYYYSEMQYGALQEVAALWDYWADKTTTENDPQSYKAYAAVASVLVWELLTDSYYGGDYYDSIFKNHGVFLAYENEIAPGLMLTEAFKTFFSEGQYLNNPDEYSIFYLGGNERLLAFEHLGSRAVPVPAAAWLLGSGLAGMGILRKRMK